MPRKPLPSPDAAASVVLNLEAARTVLLLQTHAARVSLRVTHYVGDGLAHGQ